MNQIENEDITLFASKYIFFQIAIHVRPSPPPRIMGKSGGPTSSAPPVSTKKLDPESEAVFMVSNECSSRLFLSHTIRI